MMLFPVRSAPSGCAKYVRWECLGDPMAEVNHGQSLKQLAERGGMSPREILANVRQVRLGDAALVSEVECVTLVNSIGAEWPRKQEQDVRSTSRRAVRALKRILGMRKERAPL